MSNPLLVIVNLRGAADGLNMLVPFTEDAYYRARPTLAIPRPGAPGRTVLDLDGRWGLHPALEPLLPVFQKGELAFVTAVGRPGGSLSHFEAWDEMDSGAIGADLPQTGWLARLLERTKSAGAMRAVAFQETMPRLLNGVNGAMALRSLDDFRLAVPKQHSAAARKALAALYRGTALPVGKWGEQSLAALEALDDIDQNTKENDGYPKTDFGEQMRGLERLIRVGVGIEAASVELRGWDTHFFQGNVAGEQARLMAELSEGLITFFSRIPERKQDITLIVLTEFGRRIAENGSSGTDHGEGSVMMVFGVGVNGGKVYGNWLGLDHPTPNGNVPVTTDFRSVLSEVIAKRFSGGNLSGIFPGFTVSSNVNLIIN